MCGADLAKLTKGDKKMTKVKKIITHPGQAHRDEFIACCLVLAAKNTEITIERREPTEEEMHDHLVYVVDVGGFHQRGASNFDHHQRGREEEPVCSITLIMEDLGWDMELARELFPWLGFSEVLDVKGPMAAAKEFDIPRESLFATLSPIEGQMLQIFSQRNYLWASDCDDMDGPTDSLLTMMLEIGRGLIRYYEEVQERLKLLEEAATFFAMYDCREESGDPEKIKSVQCVKIDVPGDKKPSLGVEMFLKRTAPGVQVVISEDDRGEGLSIFRRENGESIIDFSRVENHDDVLFAHKGGFICKTKSRKDPVFEIITEAMV
jgi:hypothetical protein